jgi:hypothetical protein
MERDRYYHLKEGCIYLMNELFTEVVGTTLSVTEWIFLTSMKKNLFGFIDM